MDAARLTVRRATVDDLSGLKELWTRARLQVLDLERRLTDFQLVVSSDSDLLAAVGLRVEGSQGWMYGEAFAQPDDQDTFRQLLWDRVLTLARNHGLARLWTTELAPFWHQVAEFKPAESQDLKRLPVVFGASHQRWQALRLRDEDHKTFSLEQEFELFQQSSRSSMNRVMSQAETLRWVAYGVAGVVTAALVSLAIYLVIRWAGEGGAGRSRRP
jgi:N-acetylglutamate synthase-like GNAT family acetyltransferase